jgi:hypothetical protein
MIRLYSGTGSQEVQVLEPAMADQAWAVTRAGIVRFLRARRGGAQAADLLCEIPFELREGTNGFNDDFRILYYCAPLERYPSVPT